MTTAKHYQNKVQGWMTSSNTSSNSIQISNSQWKPNNSFSSTKLSRNDDKDTCGHRTRDGSRCEFPNPPFDDGKCLWHTSEQCFRATDDGSVCELPGSRDDGACHIHTKGCNESLTHTALEKACFHGMKFPYRMLGLHPDTSRSRGAFSIQPQIAAEVAARVGKGYLEAIGEEYDREESHKYYVENIIDKEVDDQSLMDKIKDALNFGGNISSLTDNGIELDIFKRGIKQSWKQVNKKEHHADGARTAIAAAEHFLDIEVEVK